jgi:HIRAN domain-containing protein
MNETIATQWLLRNWPLWLAFILGFVPMLIAAVKHRPRTRWYLYGLACALVAWPLVTLPTIHALFLRRRNGMSEQFSLQQRRADALALLAEESVRSYPSWIAELNRRSPAGVDRRRYAYEHLTAGDPLELVRGPNNPTTKHAVSYYHRAVHLGYVPKRHHWIAEALDDGLRLAVIVEEVKPGWFFRRRAKFVGTRIVILYDGR